MAVLTRLYLPWALLTFLDSEWILVAAAGLGRKPCQGQPRTIQR
jgi:hypothetical protein